MRRLLPSFLFVLFLVSPLEKAVAVPPDTCNEVIFYSEDHEGTTDWTSPTNYDGDAQYELAWEYGAGTSYSGSQRWFINNYGASTEARLESPEITIPSNATNDVFLRFAHAYNTELGDDGGIVEVSVNGGGFSDVGVTRFTQGGYPRSFNGDVNVLGIREAFTGSNPNYPAYMESIVDLSTLVDAENTIVIRFRFATDEDNAGTGWFVDDVQLGYCAASNTPPAADDLTISTLEDTPVTDSVTATDEDGDSLTFSLGTAPANGVVSVNDDGSFTYTPNADYSGTDSFAVQVDDGNGGSDVALVDVTIIGVNDAPSFTLSGNPPAIDEDTGAQTVAGFATSISGGPVNESGQSLTFDVTVVAGSLTFTSSPAIDVATGDLTYEAAPDANGTATIQVLLRDDGGTSDGGVDTSVPQTVIITVNSLNDPPIASDLTTSTPEDTPLNGTITAVDVDGDPMAFSIGTPPANGAATVNPDGSFNYIPAVNFSGADSFTVTVNDGNGGSDTATVTVNVSDVNDNPTVDAGSDQTTDLNIPVTVNATYSDADAVDTHTARIDWGDGASDDVSAVSGSVSGSHTYTASGNFTVTITVSDNNGGSGSDTLIVSVNAPTFTPTPTATSTPEPSPTLTPTATDIAPGSPTDVMPTASPTSTTGAEPPPPAPLAVEANHDPESVVRVGVPDGMSTDVYMRVIVADGKYVIWQGSELTNGGFIGNQGVLDMGVWQAVDIFSPTGLRYFEGGIVICLRGGGTLVYLNANNAPRIAEIVGSYSVPEFPGFTCVTLFEPGTLVLVDPV